LATRVPAWEVNAGTDLNQLAASILNHVSPNDH
jgi:hypothetical protein